MKTQTGLVSKGLLWGIAAFLCIWFVLWLIVWPIVLMAPTTSHYKAVLPFTTAIELELGKVKATSLVVGERLEYCSYIPVQMCVKLFLNQSNTTANDLERVRQIAHDICGVLKRANPVAVQEMEAARQWRPGALQWRLSGQARCVNTGESQYAETPEIPPEVSNGLWILTFVNPPVYAYQITFNSMKAKEKP